MAGTLDCDLLLQSLREWQGSNIGNAERASFFRDMELLWEVAPVVPSTVGHRGAETVIEQFATLKAFLKNILFSALSSVFRPRWLLLTQEPCLFSK